MSRKANLLLRLRAALWCAAVAGALCVGYLLYQRPSPWYDAFLFFVVSSIVPAAVSGWLIGWHFLDPTQYHDAFIAVLLGLATTLLAYPIMVGGWVAAGVVSAFWAGDINWASLNDPQAIYVLWILFYVPLAAIWFTGWLTLPAGGIAAYLLSRHYCKKRPSDPPLPESTPGDLPNSEAQPEA